MANTLIQLKSSTSNAAPIVLDVAEPAYSYVSNTLFIGTAAGNGVLPIGGQFYVAQQELIFAKTNAAFAAANTGSGAASAGSYANSAFLVANTPNYVANSAASYANAGFAVANSAASYANSSFLSANTPSNVANSAALYANSAFAAANNASDTWVRNQANAAFLQANTPSYTANSAALYANSAFLQANTPSYVANSAAAYANGAFAAANTKFNSSGGTITGDTSITGNLTVTGTTTYTNTVTVLIADNIITVNAAISQSAQPTSNAGIEVDRGAQPNSSFLWIETAGKWSANNGNASFYIAADSAESYANAAFAAANAANATDATQNASITAAFIQANAAFLQANTPSNVANSAASYANAAFTAANTAGGSVQGNTINLGSNTVGLLVSNAVTLTTTTKVTDGLALINNVLGKLVPPGPPAFPSSNTISIASVSSYRMTNFSQTDRTSSSRGVAAGTTVTNTRRAATYSITPTIPDQGPGDSGTLTLFVNGANTVAYTFTSSSANGTYTSGGHSLVISDSVDYGSKIVGTAQGFWRSFDCSANGTVSNGWNELFITHSGASSTNTPFWYYDDSAPGAVVVNNGSLTVNSAAYSNSSTIPHYTSATLFNLGFNISKLSGDMYPTSDTFVASAAGGAFGANSGVTYAQAGITTPLARNLYVSSGQATVNLTSAIVSGFGNSSTGVVVTGQNSYTAGTLSVTPGVTIQYKTGNTSSNTVIGGEDNLFFGSTVGTGSTAAFRIVNPGSTDNPAYANGASAFNSTSGTLEAYDATVVAATLKHDITNYSTGYLPVGPNLSSGRSGPQYFTFKFVRTSLSKFDIQFTGNTAGVWVAAPGTVIDSTSSLNGWLSMTTAYAGSGIPGANAPGNGSNGCALGGTITANTAVTTHRKTCTFGTVSTSNSTGNEVYVRIKLLAGQTITALSLQTANN